MAKGRGEIFLFTLLTFILFISPNIIGSLSAFDNTIISEDSPFGIMDAFELNHPSFVRNMGFTDDQYLQWAGNQLRYLGVKWSRGSARIIWELVEPELGKGYNWSQIDKALKDAYRNGGDHFNMVVVISPSRSRGSPPDINKSEEEYFKKFVQSAVERYDGDGVDDFDSNIKVKYWQAYAEPFPRQWVRGGGTIDGYIRFLELLSGAAKEADPQAKIVLGAQVMIRRRGEIDLSSFKEVISKLKGKKVFDSIDLHYWETAKEYKIPQLDELRSLLDSNGYSEARIFSLENGTYIHEPEIFPTQSEKDQATYLIKSYCYNLSHGVSLIAWNNLIDWANYGGNQRSIYNHMGLISDGENQESQQTLGVPRLSYYTYKLMVDKLGGSNWNNVKRIIDGKDHVYLFQFTKEGRPIWVGWWDWFQDKGSQKSISIKVNSDKITITSAIPDAESGDRIKQKVIFKSETPKVDSGHATIIFETNPVYIEEGEVEAPSYEAIVTTTGRSPLPEEKHERQRLRRTPRD